MILRLLLLRPLDHDAADTSILSFISLVSDHLGSSWPCFFLKNFYLKALLLCVCKHHANAACISHVDIGLPIPLDYQRDQMRLILTESSKTSMMGILGGANTFTAIRDVGKCLRLALGSQRRGNVVVKQFDLDKMAVQSMRDGGWSGCHG